MRWFWKAWFLLDRHTSGSLLAGAQGPSRGDLALGVIPCFFGSACFYVFFAAFGRLLGMLGRLGAFRIFVSLPGSLGACGAHVFVASFGGFLRVLRPLFGHAILLLIVCGVIVPREPELHALTTGRSPGSLPGSGPFLFVLADVCVSIKAVPDLSRFIHTRTYSCRQCAQPARTRARRVASIEPGPPRRETPRFLAVSRGRSRPVR